MLIIGFWSVYVIFVLDMSFRSASFCGFVCPFISMNTNVAWYPGENDAIIFRKSVHLSKSLVMRGVDAFCSVELGGLIWSLNG